MKKKGSQASVKLTVDPKRLKARIEGTAQASTKLCQSSQQAEELRGQVNVRVRKLSMTGPTQTISTGERRSRRGTKPSKTLRD